MPAALRHFRMRVWVIGGSAAFQAAEDRFDSGHPLQFSARRLAERVPGFQSGTSRVQLPSRGPTLAGKDTRCLPLSVTN
jgi:hypothetical protein